VGSISLFLGAVNIGHEKIRPASRSGLASSGRRRSPMHCLASMHTLTFFDDVPDAIEADAVEVVAHQSKFNSIKNRHNSLPKTLARL
jgi:hypothetical protein